MKSKDVVAAIIKTDNVYLIAQRNINKYMGLTWEFPGGKVEYGETVEEAVRREMMEEVGLQLFDLKLQNQCYYKAHNYSQSSLKTKLDSLCISHSDFFS